MANIKQGQQMIPFITREMSVGQNVSELVFGVDVFDLDFGLQINSIKQPIKMIILITRGLDIFFEGTESIFSITLIFPLRFLMFLGIINKSPLFFLKLERRFQKTETMRSHNSRASKPSNLSPVSNDMISDSVELCETAVCFLHIQLSGKIV